MESKHDILNKIELLHKKQSDLTQKLKQSFAIQDIWPGCQWPVLTWVQGGLSDGFVFCLRDKTDKIIKINLDKIPKVFLKADHIRRALDKIKLMDFKGDYIRLTNY